MDASYQAHFEETVAPQTLDEQLGNEAQRLAERHGLAAMDALHLAAALRLGAEEFYTVESPGNPCFELRSCGCSRFVRPDEPASVIGLVVFEYLCVVTPGCGKG